MRSGLLVLVFSVLTNMFISILVVLRNYRRIANIAFGMTSLSLVLWSTFNFLSSYLPSSYTLAATRITGVFGVLLITSFYMLTLTFPAVLPTKKYTLKLLGVWLIFTCIISLTSLFIASAVVTEQGLVLKEGAIYSLYPLYILALFVLCNVNFVRQYRRARRLAKSQIKFMWLAIIVTVALITCSNVIVPAFTSSWSSSKYGTIFTIPFVAITAFAIVKQHMFDVRLAITRFIGYTVTIGIIATLYSVTVVLFNTQLLRYKEMSPSQLFILTIPTIFVGLTFNRIATYVARITQRIFYEDAYDAQDVLDELSDALLAENDIDKIMQQSLEVINTALKPQGAYFAVLSEKGNVYHQIQTGDMTLSSIDPFLVRLRKESEILIDADVAPDRLISKVMASQNIELLLRLGAKEEPTGMLLFGPKRNGSMYTKQDVELLKISAKNLGIALQNAKKYEQIIHFADTLHKEVDRATKRLRTANEKLKTLDALKDDFISTASHQLRTPAVSVHDALHMLNYPNVSKKDRDDLLQLAESSSERLVTVVRTMLNMARLQAGHFTIDTSDADFIDIIERELDQVKVLADQKSIKIDFEKPAEPLPCKVDVAKIGEAVANYIENAIKYSLENTTISIVVTKEHGKIRFEVHDQGMGVPPDEREKLFSRFYRATNARQEQPDGNGIGLYVVRNIAEGHGGETYYRPGVNGGSVFGLWIIAQTKK